MIGIATRISLHSLKLSAIGFCLLHIVAFKVNGAKIMIRSHSVRSRDTCGNWQQEYIQLHRSVTRHTPSNM